MSGATVVAINVSGTTVAGQGVAQHVNRSHAPSGWRIVRQNSSTPNTSTSFLPFPRRLPLSPTRIKAEVYDILFRAAAETLRTIAADPRHLGADIGFFGVLHSWGQNLLFHPHIHFVVPGGGSRWTEHAGSLPDSASSFRSAFCRVFFAGCSCAIWRAHISAGRLMFFSSLQHLSERAAFQRYLAPVRTADWVIYAKKPFAGPQQVLDYVGRYTHRIAISNNRLLSINDGKIRSRWKDYRNRNHLGAMTLTAEEFIRRFLLHVLPEGFQRIRYYGFLCNRYRQQKLRRCRELLGMVDRERPPPANNPMIIAITTRPSWVFPSRNAQFATMDIWSLLKSFQNLPSSGPVGSRHDTAPHTRTARSTTSPSSYARVVAVPVSKGRFGASTSIARPPQYPSGSLLRSICRPHWLRPRRDAGPITLPGAIQCP